MSLISSVAARVLVASRGLLGRRIIHALSWTMSGHIAQQVIRFGFNLLLTRLLAPEIFGIMAAILAVQMILANLSDIGLNTGIIQSPRGEDPRYLHTIWTLQIARGIAIWLMMILIATAIRATAGMGWFAPGSAWGAPVLPSAMMVIGFTAVIDGFGSTKSAVARRKLMYRQIVLIDLASQLASLAVVLAIIRVSPTVWPMVVGALFGASFRCVMTHLYLPGTRDRLGWNKQDAAEIAKFGSWLLLASTATVISMTIDRLLFGAIFPVAMLGLYSIALGLSSIVETVGSRIMIDVMVPSMSEAARSTGDGVRQRLYRARVPLDVLYLGAAGALYVMAPTIIQLLYDARYHDAGRFLQILSFGLIFSRYGTAHSAYIAMGHSRKHAMVMIAKVSASLVATLLGNYLYGLEGALWGIALHGILTLPFIFYFNAKLGLNFWRFELMVLPAWLVGYLLGLSLIRVIANA